MSMIGMEAAPLSAEMIGDFANRVRRLLGCVDGERVDVEAIIDLRLPLYLEDFYYLLKDEEEMGCNHGQAIPARSEISLRQDVYHGMCKGDPQHCETVMHEIGHLLMHKPDRVTYNRNTGRELRQECDPEWQADQFAAEFLAHHSIARQCMTAAELSRVAGVPLMTAIRQWKRYKEAGLI